MGWSLDENIHRDSILHIFLNRSKCVSACISGIQKYHLRQAGNIQTGLGMEEKHIFHLQYFSCDEITKWAYTWQQKKVLILMLEHPLLGVCFFPALQSCAGCHLGLSRNVFPSCCYRCPGRNFWRFFGWRVCLPQKHWVLGEAKADFDRGVLMLTLELKARGSWLESCHLWNQEGIWLHGQAGMDRGDFCLPLYCGVWSWILRPLERILTTLQQ